MQNLTKFIALVALCILAACLNNVEGSHEEMMVKYMDALEACMPEVGASKADMEDVLKFAPGMRREAKCLQACLMMKFTTMDADGKISRPACIEQAMMLTGGDADRMKIATEIIDDCISVVHSPDFCDAAVDYGRCFMSHAAARGVQMF